LSLKAPSSWVTKKGRKRLCPSSWNWLCAMGTRERPEARA
jgi:hypothetical protein